MQEVVEKFDSLAGWTASDPSVVIYGLNEVPEYIAGYNQASLTLYFKGGSAGEYAEKVLPAPITLGRYRELVFHIWSRYRSMSGDEQLRRSDFKYQIDLVNAGAVVQSFLIPTYETLSPVSLFVGDLALTFDTIRVISLLGASEDDYLILSNMLLVRDDLPRDLFLGLKQALEMELSYLYGEHNDGVAGKGIKILTGQVLTAGDKSFYVPGSAPYLDKYAVIKIEDGVHSEVHQIELSDEKEIKFMSTYDGKALLYTYASADIYVVIPVEFGVSETEIMLPGMVIWGINPEEVFRSAKTDEILDTYKPDGTVRVRQSYQTFRYGLLIDVEARQNEFLVLGSRAIKSVLAREQIWVLGRKINILNAGPAVAVDPVQGYNEIPKIQYEATVEIREEIATRQTIKNMTFREIEYIIER